ncbi:MAG: BTAD domain-containing putative transcriptional regulator, partial [Gemmatimonadales bacterium]
MPLGSVVSEEELGPHRQKLALLAVLAMSKRPLSRDQLVGMFWGDQPDERARHSLSNALSFLRRVLGREAIRRHRDEVVLDPGIPLRVDAREFEEAVAGGRFSEALACHPGPFLDGVYIGGAGEFERWAEGERNRLEGLFLRACEGAFAQLAAAQDWADAEDVARRWLDAAPLSGQAAAALLDAITARGGRDADQRALETYDRLVTRLGEEYHRRPDRVVMDRARAIVERLRATDATGEFRVPTWALEAPGDFPESEVKASPPAAPGGTPAPLPAAEPAVRRFPWRYGLVAAAALVLAWGWWSGRETTAVTPAGPPVVAIGPVRAPSDSAGTWLGEGMTQMLSARLARSTMVEVVSPERMRELLPAAATLSQVLDAARRAGAQWVVSGGITRAEQGYVMDVNVHAVADGRLVSLNTVTGTDPIRLADRVAVLVMVAAGTSPEGPSLAEVETANPLAYEAYVRFLRASNQERTADALAALDEAIALDSGFVTALRERASLAFPTADVALLTTLLDAFRRHEHRATEFDRLYLAAQ